MRSFSRHTVRWRHLGRHFVFWLSAEILLGLVGLDDLADCVEYLITRQRLAMVVYPLNVREPMNLNQRLTWRNGA